MVGEGKVPVNTGFVWGMYPWWGRVKYRLIRDSFGGCIHGGGG